MTPCRVGWSLLRILLLLAASFHAATGGSIECVGALDQPCDSGLCYDAIHTVQGVITNGCATKELCIQTGCGLILAANGSELFMCCCENSLCNGKSRGLIQARFRMWKEGNYKSPPRVGHLMADEGRISTRQLQTNTSTPTESTDLSKSPSDEAEQGAVKRPVAASTAAPRELFETTAENVLSAADPKPVRSSPADTSITRPSSRRPEDGGRIEASHLGGPHVALPTPTSEPIVHSNADQPVDGNAIFVPNTPRFTPPIREEETSTATTPPRPTTTASRPSTTTSSTTTTTTTPATTTTPTTTTSTTPTTTAPTTTPVTYQSTTTTANIPLQTTKDDSTERDNAATPPALIHIASNHENDSTTSTPYATTTHQIDEENNDASTTTVEVLPTNLILEDDEKPQESESVTSHIQSSGNDVVDASTTASTTAHTPASFPWWIIGVLFLGALLLVFTVGAALIVIKERRSDSATLTGNVEEPQNVDPLLTHRSGD
uniref:Uncharacterized protein n=1 Tax=Plectus sambesii TaxID=2011161 RepID=A0A914V1G6_9BILA